MLGTNLAVASGTWPWVQLRACQVAGEGRWARIRCHQVFAGSVCMCPREQGGEGSLSLAPAQKFWSRSSLSSASFPPSAGWAGEAGRWSEAAASRAPWGRALRRPGTYGEICGLEDGTVIMGNTDWHFSVAGELAGGKSWWQKQAPTK